MNLMAVAHKSIKYFSKLDIVIEELVDVIEVLSVHNGLADGSHLASDVSQYLSDGSNLRKLHIIY